MAFSLKHLMSRHALTLRFAVIPALALLSLTGLLYAGTTFLVAKELTEQANLRVQQRSTLLATRLQNAFAACLRGVEQLTHYEALNKREGNLASRSEMEWLQAEIPAFVWIGFVTTTGRVEAATKGWLEGADVSLRPVYLRSLERLSVADFHPAVALSPYLTPSRGPGELTSSVADIGAPVRDPQGRLLGVVATHLSERWFAELAESTVTDVEARRLGLSWYVVTGNGLLMSRQPLPFKPPPADGATHTLTGTDGREYLVSSVSVGSPASATASLGWRVVVASDTAAALAPLREFDRTLALFAFAGCLLFSAWGFVAARRTTRPVDRLFAAVRARFEAAGGSRLMPYHDYLEEMGDELAATPLLERDAGEDILRRLAKDARQLKRVIDHLPMGVAISSTDFRVEYVNPAYSQMLGWTTGDIRGRRTAEFLFAGIEREQFVAQLDALVLEPSEFMARFEAVCANGKRLPIQWHMVPFYDARGTFSGVLAVVQDISGETKAQRHAVAMSNRLELFAEAALDYVLALMDANGRILTWSHGAHAVLGWSAAEAEAVTFAELFTDTERSLGVPERLLSAAKRRGQCEVEAQFRRKAAGNLVGQGTLYALPASTDAACFVFIMRDTTEQHEAARKLQLSEQQLAGLTQRLLEQEKQTTRRLGQALHDELGQTLGAMRLLFDAGRNKMAPQEPLPAWIARLDGLIHDSNTQVRQVLTELRPPLLDDHGLLAALDNELQQRRALQEDVRLALDASGVPADQRWSADVEYAFFMVAREAVNNALRHASPSSVRVTVTGDDLSFSLSVSDDGAADVNVPRAKAGHLGLVGMRERALAIGAQLSITSEPNQGTTVLLQWEMPDEPPVSGR